MEKQKFDIEVCRTGIGFATIQVEATSQEEAEQLAIDEAGDHEYSEKSSEYDLCSNPKQRGDKVWVEWLKSFWVLCVILEGNTAESTIYTEISASQMFNLKECGVSVKD